VVLTGDTDKMAGMSPSSVVWLESFMIFKLVYDRDLSEEGVQRFIRETEDLAREWNYY